jgi:hypothetical protein
MIDVAGIFPTVLSLENPYPNPFNPETRFRVSLIKNEELKVSVYDINGFVVGILFNGNSTQDLYDFNWNASSFSSGIYFIEVKTSSEALYKKIILTK